MFTPFRKVLKPLRPWVWAGTGLFAVASVGAWAYDDVAAPEVGLSGILAVSPPDDLGTEALGRLQESIDETWKPWLQETTQQIQAFYEAENPSLDDQRAALAQLRGRLETMQSSLADPRYVTIHDEISELHARLAPRVEIAAAILDVVSADPAALRQHRVQTAMAELNSALGVLDSDLAGFSNGTVWHDWAQTTDLRRIAGGSEVAGPDADLVGAIQAKIAGRDGYEAAMKEFVSRPTFLRLEGALNAVKGVSGDAAEGQKQVRDQLVALVETLDKYDAAPDAALSQQIRNQFHALTGALGTGQASLEQALRAYYLNFNFRVLVSEGFIERVVNENRRESDWVNECMQNAHITGCTCTNAWATADVVPCPTEARIMLNLNGNIRANLGASVPQATVYTVGHHRFSAHMGIYFDGYRFATEQAYVSASANNQAVDATTSFTGIPLLGPLARNIALSKADDQMGQANATTVQRIRSEVCSQLNNEVRNEFADATADLETKLHSRLRNRNLSPDVLQVSSTDDLIQIHARVLGGKELGGSRPAPGAAVPSQGVTIQVHESAMTNAAQRLDLAGKTMTNDELKQLLEERLEELLDRDVDLPEATTEEGDENAAGTFVFDSEEAIRFVIEEGEVKIVLRAGLSRPNSEVPPQKITVPLKFRLEGDKIVMSRGQVRVEPIPGQPPANVTEQVARSRIMIGKIEASIPEKSFDNSLEVKQQDKVLNLQVRDIIAHGGWLTISAE